jgi:uncharacterized SAM-binding protein YcdF (DUF218 family)
MGLMFFVASKVFAFVATPSNILILCVLAGAALLGTRFAPAGRRLLIGGALLIAIVGLLPVGSVLIHILEQRFPPWQAGATAPIGFIVLGAAIDPVLSADRQSPALGEEAERITITAELARRFPTAKFIYSGGNSSLLGGPGEADDAIALMQSFGIARERIKGEGQSRNTEENVRFSKALADPRPGDRWVVVTSAAHMPRAIGVFRAAGFDVEAYPVDWRTKSAVRWWRPNTSFVSGLRKSDEAAHEYFGLATYWLTGRTSELFPGPR